MKILSKAVDEVFRLHPKVVEDAKTMKSAQNYLNELVLKELGDISKLDLDAVFNAVNWKLWSKKSI